MTCLPSVESVYFPELQKRDVYKVKGPLMRAFVCGRQGLLLRVVTRHAFDFVLRTQDHTHTLVQLCGLNF